MQNGPSLGFRGRVIFPTMLRMRPKPTGAAHPQCCTPWSEADIADLQALLREPVTVRHIAEFLRRDVADDQVKINECRR
jgi:hypothetical protein